MCQRTHAIKYSQKFILSCTCLTYKDSFLFAFIKYNISHVISLVVMGFKMCFGFDITVIKPTNKLLKNEERVKIMKKWGMFADWFSPGKGVVNTTHYLSLSLLLFLPLPFIQSLKERRRVDTPKLTADLLKGILGEIITIQEGGRQAVTASEVVQTSQQVAKGEV